MNRRPTPAVATRLLALVLAAAPANRGSAASADVETVADRVRSTLVEPAVSATAIDALRASLLPDGSWADVDYASTAATQWPPTTHLLRLRDLARAHASPASPYVGDAGVRADALAAFDAWTTRDPTSTNWYQNEINAPQKIGETMLLLEPHLSAAQRSAGIAILARAYVPRSTNSGTNTGANRIDRAYSGILRGLLENDEAGLTEAFLAIGDTILVTTAEGIQPDHSYQQHGAQLHIQGYGVVYIAGVMKYGGWAAGTPFGFDGLQTRALVDFLLDGVQWFIRGDTTDFTAAGRGLTRAGQASTARAFLAPLQAATAVGGGYRAVELDAFATRLAADLDLARSDPTTALVGHRHFWRSDSSVFHQPGFSVFLKTSSTRTRQPESGNGEGLKNLHLADGVTLIQRDGNEYDDIMPVWDWRALPGTTIEQATYSLKPPSDWGVTGTSTHAGGVSDGRNGCSAFAYQRKGVTARKSWFFLGGRMIALGAAIDAPNATAPVLTTVNQCLLRGPVSYSTGSGNPSVLAVPRQDLAGVEWVHHDGIGYFFPDGSGPLTLRGESRTGSWSSINSTQSSAAVTRSVFGLHLDHGTRVANGRYAYVVAPVAEAGSMAASAPTSLSIERNDATVQAVRDADAGITAASFWSAGSVAGLSSSAPGLVLVRQDGDQVEVTLADPTQSLSGDWILEFDQPVGGTLHADTGIVVEGESPVLRLRASMAGTSGRSLRARFHVRPHAYERLSLPADADTFVHEGEPAAAHGDGESVAAKLPATPGSTRFAYLRFHLPELGAAPAAATLRLHPLAAQAAGLHGIQPLPASGWTEETLSWNDRPEPHAPAAAVWLPAAGQATALDLTGPAGRAPGPLDLALIPLTRTSDGLVSYGSREHPDPALRPTLELLLPRPEIEIWRIERFGDRASDPTIAGDAEDPDGDGLRNAIEFVLGGDPLADSSALHPEARLEADRCVFSFRRSRASRDEDVFVEQSSDLAAWSLVEDGTDGVAFATRDEPGEPDVDRIEVSVPPDPGTERQRFFRLGIRR